MRVLAGLLLLLGVWFSQEGDGSPSPESRAIAYLANEVSLWSRENHCFSCHNNGDGARALYTARRLSYAIPEQSLAATTQWLAQPLEWDNNRGEPGFSDKQLARIQFAASLVEAFEAGLIEDREILVQAAESLLPYQKDDGSWQVDVEAVVGSPVTYGTALATSMVRKTLEKADLSRFAAAITRADDWLLETPLKSTLDAAAVVIALEDRSDPRVEAKVGQCLELIVGGQASDGGWGPYRNSPSEPFDTAVVVLALLSVRDRPQMEELIEQGRTYLLQTQLSAGGWPETTRPPGSQSYAQHISTSSWATLALLLSDLER
jgi:hypothetical protein